MNFFPPLVEALLYLFAIGMGIGTYVKEIDGIPYVNFIAPAILAIAVMNSAFFECTYGSYVRMYYQKSFDAMIATPLSIEDVIAGEMLWGATRSVIYVIIMLPVLAVFGVISFPFALLSPPRVPGRADVCRYSDVFYRDFTRHRHAKLSLVPVHHTDGTLLGNIFPAHTAPGQSPVFCTGHLTSHPPRCHHADVHAPFVFIDDPAASGVDPDGNCDFLYCGNKPDEKKTDRVIFNYGSFSAHTGIHPQFSVSS